VKAKSDCEASYQAGPPPLRIEVESSVGALFGRASEAAARAAASLFEAPGGTIRIEDDGALDYVVASRVEAALRAAGLERLPAASPEPRADRLPPSSHDRRRITRLYLPGNQPDLVPNADLFGADCLILDLEDSVAPERKLEARVLVRRTLEARALFFRRAEVAVRINPLSGPWGEADVAELSACLPQAVILPKCERPEDVASLSALLDLAEATRGAGGRTLIMPLLETAAGVLAAEGVARASGRVAALLFGAEDFARDIGARRSAEGREALHARGALVIAAKAAGVQALDSVYSEVDDEEGLARYCSASRDLGFDGVGLVHPRQISIAQRAFSPSAEEIEEARKVVAALEEAHARGSGVASVGGKMIDAPVAARARRVLGSARRIPRSAGGEED
jgi:Citrate lyase beta subunit